MFFSLVFLAAGIFLLVRGARLLVHSASTIALKLNIPSVIVGLTVVAFGTSAPELFISITSALNDAPFLAIGNVLGSNIANMFLVLGLTAIAGSVVVSRSTIIRDIPIILLGSVVLLFLGNDRWYSISSVNTLSIRDGLVLLGFFLVFLYSLLVEKQFVGNRLIQHFRFRHAYQVTLMVSPYRIIRAIFRLLVAAVALWLGAQAFVYGAIEIGRIFNVSEVFIGLGVAALGTSLPELATTLTALWKHEADIAVGNVIGSNIFNLLMILGVTSLVRPLAWSTDFNIDLLVNIGGITLLLFLIWLGRSRRTISKGEGFVLFAAYLVYFATLIGRFAVI